MYRIIILLLFTITSVHLKYMDEDMLLFWRRSNNPDCNPFTVFTKNCNKCVCGADGASFCTRMDCEQLGRNYNKVEKVVDSED